MAAGYVDAPTLKAWLSDGAEIALIDVREAGQYGEGHAFFAVPLPYSRFEPGLPALVPNTAARIVLSDDGDGVAERAARRAEALGYTRVHVLTGGAPAWQRAGYTLFKGVNVPSKTFGEIVEHQRHTPRISAERLRAMVAAGDNVVIVDGRPVDEYRRMSIPGGICCPNGELALRIKAIAPDPATTIVVNCAGRTRSIIGAQTLIDMGVPNKVLALENGTQGWFLAGLTLERGASRTYPTDIGRADTERQRARDHARSHGAAFVTPAQAHAWLLDSARTTYLLDVRTAEEVAESAVPGFVHAPGGQLIQSTDQWVGVKGARLVLLDAEAVRAPVAAAWLRQLGHDAYVLDGGTAAAARFDWRRGTAPARARALALTSPAQLAGLADVVEIIDIRSSADFRRAHLAGARWSIRPRIASACDGAAKPVVLVADDAGMAALAAIDLAEVGSRDVRYLTTDVQGWRDAGLPVVATSDDPPDAARIDFLFFVHDRHDGNADAARRYLEWETGLLAQLDEQERGVFRIAPP